MRPALNHTVNEEYATLDSFEPAIYVMVRTIINLSRPTKRWMRQPARLGTPVPAQA